MLLLQCKTVKFLNGDRGRSATTSAVREASREHELWWRSQAVAVINDSLLSRASISPIGYLFWWKFLRRREQVKAAHRPYKKEDVKERRSAGPINRPTKKPLWKVRPSTSNIHWFLIMPERMITPSRMQSHASFKPIAQSWISSTLGVIQCY